MSGLMTRVQNFGSRIVGSARAIPESEDHVGAAFVLGIPTFGFEVWRSDNHIEIPSHPGTPALSPICAVLPLGNAIAVAAPDQVVQVWDLATATLTQTLHVPNAKQGIVNPCLEVGSRVLIPMERF